MGGPEPIAHHINQRPSMTQCWSLSPSIAYFPSITFLISMERKIYVDLIIWKKEIWIPLIHLDSGGSHRWRVTRFVILKKNFGQRQRRAMSLLKEAMVIVMSLYGFNRLCTTKVLLIHCLLVRIWGWTNLTIQNFR